MRRVNVLSAFLLLAALVGSANLAQAAAQGSKPAAHRSITKIVPRVIGSGRTVPVGGARAGVPAHGRPPAVLKASAYRAFRFAMHERRAFRPVPRAGGPPNAKLKRLIGKASASHGHAYWNGSRWVIPAAGAAPRRAPRLLIPRPPARRTGLRAVPLTLYGSTQVDSATSQCSSLLPNEASVAQSSYNPNLVVVAAQASVDSSGKCADSHAWEFYSHDGGQHWAEQIIPRTNTGLVSGDVAVVYDPKHHVFVYSFLQFSRTTSTNSINAESSADGASWFDFVTLDSHAGALDKDMITVDQRPASPHYGRVLVAWRDDSLGQNAFTDAFTDNGGESWTTAAETINTVPDCGNGISPAFNADGEAMGAWLDCDGGSTEEETLSTDGGAHWTKKNTVISAMHDISPAGDNSSSCKLKNGGTAFRCNSFPSLAGDPSDHVGGSAFFVVFANWESTTQGGKTAKVSQLHGLSTIDDGKHWDGGSCCSFDYMAPDNFGDKFFPWASFSPNGKLNVGYSDRELSASASNPNGKSFSEGQTEASGLSALRNDSFTAYQADATLGNPGTLKFIGDYSGIESEDRDYDTFPVWTDVRGGTMHVRTMDLCYIACPSFLEPDTPRTVSRVAGSSFQDRYKINIDGDFGGSGSDFWNAVGIRSGSDGTSVDDDIGLWDTRYFNNRVALGALHPPSNDYVVANGGFGHAAAQPYFIDVHNSSGSSGGTYTLDWAPGHTILATAHADSMGSGDVVRVYEMVDATGTTYFLGLRPAAGNTSGYRVSVHLTGGGDFQSSSARAATSGNAAPGQPAFTSVHTGTSPSGVDAVVVQNNNGGSGSYTLYRDTKAPSGTITVNSGAAFTGNTHATLTLSATNPTAGDPVSDMRFSSDGTTFGPWMPFAASASFTLAAGNGTRTVFAQFRNAAGAISPTVSDSITLDTTRPVITKVPAPSFQQVQLGTTAVPILIKWAGADGTSGIAHFDLQRSADGGAFSTVASPTTAQASVNLNPGHSYQFRVRATDNAGNVSGFTAGRTFTLSAFQETDGAITYSGGWAKQAVSGSYGGSVKFATAAGKTATFSFTGSQVAWVSTIDSNRGSATARLDSGTPPTINTNGTTLQPAMVVYAKAVTAGAHTLLLRVLGAIGHPRVDVDAFLVIS